VHAILQDTLPRLHLRRGGIRLREQRTVLARDGLVPVARDGCLRPACP
jgi:hypothetical protein